MCSEIQVLAEDLTVPGDGSEEAQQALNNATTSQKYWNPLFGGFRSDLNQTMWVNALEFFSGGLLFCGDINGAAAVGAFDGTNNFTYATNGQMNSTLTSLVSYDSIDFGFAGGVFDVTGTSTGFIAAVKRNDDGSLEFAGEVEQLGFSSINAITIQSSTDNNALIVYAGFTGGHLVVGRCYVLDPTRGVFFTPDPTFTIFNATTTGITGNYQSKIGIAVDSQNRIIVVGTGGGRMRVARFNPNGGLDTSFNSVGYKDIAAGEGHAVAVAPFDSIIAVGADAGSPKKIMIAVMLQSGTFLSTFGTNGIQSYTLGNGNGIAYGVGLTPPDGGTTSYIAVAGNVIKDGVTYMGTLMVDYSGVLVPNFCSTTATPGYNLQPAVGASLNQATCMATGIYKTIPAIYAAGSDATTHPNFAAYVSTV